MNQDFSWERFNRLPIVGILRGYGPELSRRLAAIAVDEGLTSIETTMNSDGVLDQIAQLTSEYGGRINIGAGTVTTLSQLDDALAAGAGFIVTPVVVEEVIKRCRDRGVPVFPGAFTPTEVFQAWRAGADMVKLFPADALGPAYIKAIKAPLNDIKLLVTGGVDLDNLDAFRRAGADGFGVGSPLFNTQRVQAEDWAWIRSRARGFVRAFHPSSDTHVA